ncbi:hypothetical protein NPIL_202611 [Nephila pilipes]|uniref:Uncharacterized protein n=1 Tax=Nephila pilipes TaxID=299642 RepID=A0A8X6QYM9_NEPPI|nr:hypothetical protein NPIL_202611 [Nephila pilipes]
MELIKGLNKNMASRTLKRVVVPRRSAYGSRSKRQLRTRGWKGAVTLKCSWFLPCELLCTHAKQTNNDIAVSRKCNGFAIAPLVSPYQS